MANPHIQTKGINKRLHSLQQRSARLSEKSWSRQLLISLGQSQSLQLQISQSQRVSVSTTQIIDRLKESQSRQP